jgi:hypothetical protein
MGRAQFALKGYAMRSRSLTHLVIILCLSVVVLGLTIAAVSPVRAVMPDEVDSNGLAHLPEFNRYVCDVTSHPYRYPLNPRADQDVAIRARGSTGNLTGVIIWYATNAEAFTITQWMSVTASVDGTWPNCEDTLGWAADSWRAVIPAQSSQVWYQIAYTDGNETLWQRDSGEGSTVVSPLPDWVASQTHLSYTVPLTVNVDGSATGGNGWDYTLFATIQNGINAVGAGGVVNVSTGIYTENVIISKSLRLVGVVPSNTITIRPTISNSNCTSGSLCNGAASNIILVQADDVTIQDLTLDGINPVLGPAIAARNGIIENHLAGTFNNLTVRDTTIRNIYLRGLSASSGGDNFNLYGNVVENVQGDPAASVAIINEGGSGTIADNNVSNASDAIAASGSRGTYIGFNTITTSGNGVRTDNNGASGGAADVVEWNTISSCSAGGYGVWVFAPYLDVSVHNNTVTGCAVGLAVAGQGAPATPAFFYNSIGGESLPGSTGIYITTDMFGFDSNNVSASFDNIVITNTTTGIYVEQSLITRTLHTTITNNSLAANTTGLEITGGNVTFAGNNVTVGTTAIAQSNGTLLAYANNFTGYTTPLSRTSSSTTNVAHNWWGDYDTQPGGVSTTDWQARLGAPLVVLGDNVVWATGSNAATLDGATLSGDTGSGDTGTAVIVNHGHSYSDAPFGNIAPGIDPCSNYYDFFTVNGSGTWNVSVPVDNSPECAAQTLDPGKIFWIPPGTDYAADCIAPNDTNPTCWDLITPTLVITGGQMITVANLSADDLGGTQFVAGSTTGTDPTAVAIVGFAATTDRSAAPAGIILAGVMIATAGLVFVARRRR